MMRKKLYPWLPVAFLAVGVWIGSVYAGNLEPSQPPGPTMKTLDQVEPRVPVNTLEPSPDGIYRHVISEAGSYYFQGDIDVGTGERGILVAADNVTIDLQGFSLIGGTGHGIYMQGRTNVEIRNGTLRGFGGNGVYEEDTGGKGHRIVRLRLLYNLAVGVRLRGHGHVVEGCTGVGNVDWAINAGIGCTIIGNIAYQNTGGGINANAGSTVKDNTAESNPSSGIVIGDGGTATGNTAYNNQMDGISAGAGCTVTNNTVYNNSRSGISTADRCTVTNNTSYKNNLSDLGTFGGIRVTSDCLVKGNTVSANNMANISVNGTDNAVEENLVTDSAIGIQFSDPGNFYANNRASGNGTNYDGPVPTGAGDGGGNASF